MRGGWGRRRATGQSAMAFDGVEVGEVAVAAGVEAATDATNGARTRRGGGSPRAGAAEPSGVGGGVCAASHAAGNAEVPTGANDEGVAKRLC